MQIWDTVFNIYPEAARSCARYPMHHAHGTTVCGHFLETVSVQITQCPGWAGGGGELDAPCCGTHRISPAFTIHMVRDDAAQFGGGCSKETAFKYILSLIRKHTVLLHT